MRIFIHTGITKKIRPKTVFAITIKSKTRYLWLPFDTGIYKIINL